MKGGVDEIAAAQGLLKLKPMTGKREVARVADASAMFPRAAEPEAGSEPLKNVRHEAFAILMVCGRDEKGAAVQLRPWEAYAEVYRSSIDGRARKADGGKASAMANASRLMREHPEITERIAYLRREIRSAVMMHRESVYADTMNKMVTTLDALMTQKKSPKVAAVIASLGAKILDETRPAEVAREVRAPETEITNQTLNVNLKISDEELREIALGEGTR